MPRPRGRSERAPQLAYSEIQDMTLDEPKRRRKATKIVRVLGDFLGSGDLEGLTALDIGTSTGYTAEALHLAGADVLGVDIDVPGLRHAAGQFAPQVSFACADGSRLPLADSCLDVVVFNHIYEHVVDADAVMSEINRVLRPDGVVYLGLGNRLQIVEPHYRLPFLSWLPHRLADTYVAATGKAPNYYERFRTRSDLVRMCAGLHLFDYTYTVLANSKTFGAEDVVPQRLANLPPWAWRAIGPVMPTFIWLGTRGERRPASSVDVEPPRPLT